MRNKIKSVLLNAMLITLFIGTSCKTKGYLPEPEHIPYNKTDYNGFYDIGENGKEFKVLNDSTISYIVIKEGAITLNRIKIAKNSLQIIFRI